MNIIEETEWEYRIFDEWRDLAEMDDQLLLELGTEGWELVAVVPSHGRRNVWEHRFIFKRLLK